MFVSKSILVATLSAAIGISGITNGGVDPLNDNDSVAPVSDLMEVAPAEAALEMPDLSATDGDSVSPRAALLPTRRISSPARCIGKTDLPHKSGRMASVHARIKCKWNVQQLKTVTTLYRERWYGYQALASDSSTTTNKYTSYDAHPHWTCSGTGTYTYWGFSNHYTLEGGKRFYARTGNGGNNRVSRFKC